MRDSRQITVLRSLFRTLHPNLTSGLKNGLENSLAPAKRMLTGAYQHAADKRSQSAAESAADENAIPPASTSSADSKAPKTADAHQASEEAPSAAVQAERRQPLPPLPKTLTDEHLVAELENATRQFELQRGTQSNPAITSSRKPAKPARGRRHFSRDTLLSLLEEAKVRIQVLETELELARGTEEHIPLLTEEWGEDMPSTLSRKPD